MGAVMRAVMRAEIKVNRLTVIRHGYDSIPPLGPNP
jgi:hypothetical protein